MVNDFIELKQQINEIIESVEFERNTAVTRALVETKIQRLMVQQANDRQIYDYEVVCDDRNNPPSVIENNNLVANINWTDIFGKKHYYGADFQNIIRQRKEHGKL